MFLKKETIGIIPQAAYQKTSKQSPVAYRWMWYVAHQHGVYIQHGPNVAERRVRQYFLDGHTHRLWASLMLLPPVSQMFSWRHGHPSEMWECEFHDFLQRKTMAKTYVDSMNGIVDPLNPPVAFYGSRVNATKLSMKTEVSPTTSR